MDNLFPLKWNLIFIILGVEVKYFCCFQLPSYKTDLKDRQIFEISSYDDYDENENEMLQPEDLRGFESLAEDEAKFQPLHFHVENYNRKVAKKMEKIQNKILVHPIIERNIREDPGPYFFGFKDELDKITYQKPEKLYAVKKRSASEETTVESSIKKLFFATPTNDVGYVKHNYKRIKRSDEDSVESTDPDFFQGPDENSTPEEMIKDADLDEYQEEKTTLSNEEKNPVRREEITTLAIDEKSQFTELTTANTDDNQGENTTQSKSGSSEDYDYEKLKVEYYQQLDEMIRRNEIYNYTLEEKVEVTTIVVFKDGRNKTVKIKPPRNCTDQDSEGFGLIAFECIRNDYKHIKNTTDFTRVIINTCKFVGFWGAIYLSIVIVIWCKKGWCCCCCCCIDLCYPSEVFETDRSYFVANPPGTLNTKVEVDGGFKIDTENFEPTLFELDAFEQMESEIRKLLK